MQRPTEFAIRAVALDGASIVVHISCLDRHITKRLYSVE